MHIGRFYRPKLNLVVKLSPFDHLLDQSPSEDPLRFRNGRSPHPRRALVESTLGFARLQRGRLGFFTPPTPPPLVLL